MKGAMAAQALQRAQPQERSNTTLLQELYDLPGCADSKVAFHFLIGAAAPPRRRG